MTTRAALVVACASVVASATVPARAQLPVSVSASADGTLTYTPSPSGDRVIDFSHAGFAGGGTPLPDAAVRIAVAPGPGDDGARIQRAIDIVSAWPPGDDGLRGAVLLLPGRFEVEGHLRLGASGVVLRGSGRSGATTTTVVATGTSRRTLVVVAGTGRRLERPDTRHRILDAYVPAGTHRLTLDTGHGLRVGDEVMVHRPSVKAWITLLGMDTFPGWRPENRLHWQEGSRDITWERVVAAVQGDVIDLDAPLTTAIDAGFGGGSVAAFSFDGRIARAGVEHLRLESAHDPARPFDEDHAWNAIELDAVAHAWVRQVEVRYFAGAAVQVGAAASHVTVEDVDARDPVSEPGGFRRRVFLVLGQLTLVQRCSSQKGKHDFAIGFTAAGPNVFRDCIAYEALDFSGPVESWASGVLYDHVRIRGHALRLTNRGVEDQGTGWAAANSLLWNCEATDVEAHSPPGAFNQAYGCKGVATGDGIVHDPRAVPFRDFFRGMAVEPRSLYEAQLHARRGAGAVRALEARPIRTDRGEARELIAADLSVSETSPGTGEAHLPPLTATGGRFMIGDLPAWTEAKGYSWFQAQVAPALAPTYGPAITRFAPGRYGTGLTDDLDEVVRSLRPGGVFVQHYGLWYDRRRVNHNYDGSPDQRTGDVWAPFMELPWARSGVGRAWDGLSRYDLERFNPWYFDRVAAFADLAERHGRVMHYAFYFQHWVLESRAHYVDFPWRPVNAVQATDLPDEVPAAMVFYDVGHPVRRELHRRYIRHTLDVLGWKRNVVFGIDREYTGSLAFVQFWLDTIAEWQREHGRTVFVSLEIPKAQADAILDDPVRGPMVTALSVHHWVYRPDGTLFSIQGDIDKAPREQVADIVPDVERPALRGGDPAFAGDSVVNAPAFQARQRALWASSPAMKYRAWREYRDRSATLVLLGQDDPRPDQSRIVEAAVPAAVRARYRAATLTGDDVTTAWAIGRPGDGYLVYGLDGRTVSLDLRSDRSEYAVTWIDGESGAIRRDAPRARGGGTVRLSPPASGRPWVVWLTAAGR